MVAAAPAPAPAAGPELAKLLEERIPEAVDGRFASRPGVGTGAWRGAGGPRGGARAAGGEDAGRGEEALRETEGGEGKEGVGSAPDAVEGREREGLRMERVDQLGGGLVLVAGLVGLDACKGEGWLEEGWIEGWAEGWAGEGR